MQNHLNRRGWLRTLVGAGAAPVAYDALVPCRRDPYVFSLEDGGRFNLYLIEAWLHPLRQLPAGTELYVGEMTPGGVDPQQGCRSAWHNALTNRCPFISHGGRANEFGTMVWGCTSLSLSVGSSWRGAMNHQPHPDTGAVLFRVTGQRVDDPYRPYTAKECSQRRFSHLVGESVSSLKHLHLQEQA